MKRVTSVQQVPYDKRDEPADDRQVQRVRRAAPDAGDDRYTGREDLGEQNTDQSHINLRVPERDHRRLRGLPRLDVRDLQFSTEPYANLSPARNLPIRRQCGRRQESLD